MEYIVILDFGSLAWNIMENNHGFIETFSTFDQADQEAKKYKEAGDCQTYQIFESVKK